MKAKPAILFLILLLKVMATSSAKANETEEQVSSDFLEFLADMEEITGDGFESWLDSENEQHTIREQKEFTNQITSPSHDHSTENQ